jgi:hypothetical protein
MSLLPHILPSHGHWPTSANDGATHSTAAGAEPHRLIRKGFQKGIPGERLAEAGGRRRASSQCVAAPWRQLQVTPVNHRDVFPQLGRDQGN